MTLSISLLSIFALFAHAQARCLTTRSSTGGHDVYDYDSYLRIAVGEFGYPDLVAFKREEFAEKLKTGHAELIEATPEERIGAALTEYEPSSITLIRALNANNPQPGLYVSEDLAGFIAVDACNNNRPIEFCVIRSDNESEFATFTTATLSQDQSGKAEVTETFVDDYSRDFEVRWIKH